MSILLCLNGLFKEGLFERSLVSGVTVAEIMIGHIVTQFLVMCVQMVVLLVFTFAIFQVYNDGPMVVIVLFTAALGMTGMCLGFVISTGEFYSLFLSFY